MKENYKVIIALGAVLFILGGLEASVKLIELAGLGIMLLGFILWIKHDVDKKEDKKNVKSK